MDTRYRNYDLHKDDIEIERLSEDHPVYDDLGDSEVGDQDASSVELGEFSKPAESPREDDNDEELNLNAIPRYESFAQIKKELVILDLERQIAWEEILSLKHEFKEDVSPSKFVPPILGTVGAISGLVILKNLIFGK